MNLKGNQFNQVRANPQFSLKRSRFDAFCLSRSLQLASCFYYTYLVFQPFALRLVQRYPANRVMFGWM